MEKAGAGLAQTSQNLFEIAQLEGKVNVDDQVNQYISRRDKILYGDPSIKQRGPDGQEIPDLGYMGTQGRTSSDVREATLKALDAEREATRNNLKSTREQLAFDAQTKRMHQEAVQRTGAHAETQWKSWAKTVNASTAGQWSAAIARDPDDPNIFPAATQKIIDAYTKTAELAGAQPGDTVWTEARDHGRRDALKTRIDAIAVNDPARASEIADKYKNILGTQYDEVAQKLRSRSDHVNGPIVADEVMGRGAAQSRSQQVIEKFKAAGYTPEQAAAVAGHFYHESGNNPNAVHDGGIGLGIAGWNGERLENLKRFAAQKGKSPNDFDTQVDFAIHELDNGEARAGAALRGAKNVTEATTAFMHYERPRGYTAATPERGDSYAQRLSNAAKFAGGNFNALPDKAQTFERILDATRGNPGLQAAALTHANRVYGVYHTEQTHAQAAFKASVQDDTAQAMRNGNVQQPKTELDFIQNMGPETGPRAYQEYQANLTLGADISSVATMSPSDKVQLIQRYEPQPGEGFAMQGKRQDALRQAITQTQKEASADSGSFAINRLPAVREAYTKFVEAQGGNDQQALATASRNFVNVTLAEQERVGIPPEKRNVLPAEVAQRLVTEITKPNAVTREGQSSTDIAKNIENQAALWGENWPLVYKQIQKDSIPLIRVVGSGVTPYAARVLTELQSQKLGDILKDQNDEKSGPIKTAVLEAFKPFGQTLAGSSDRLDIFNDFRGQAEKLAAYYVVNGKNATEAAEQAFKDLLGHKYTFTSTYRIPKSEPYPQKDIEYGASALRQTIKGEDLAPPRDTIGGLGAEYLAGVKPKALARDGIWVTAPGDTGLMLVYNDEAVRTKAGTPYIKTWKEVAAAGQAAVKSWTGRDVPTEGAAGFVR